MSYLKKRTIVNGIKNSQFKSVILIGHWSPDAVKRFASRIGMTADNARHGTYYTHKPSFNFSPKNILE